MRQREAVTVQGRLKAALLPAATRGRTLLGEGAQGGHHQGFVFAKVKLRPAATGGRAPAGDTAVRGPRGGFPPRGLAWGFGRKQVPA